MEINRENIKKVVLSSTEQIEQLRKDKKGAEKLLGGIERSEGSETERYKIQQELVHEIGIALEQSQQLLNSLNIAFMSFLGQEQAIQQGIAPQFSEEEIAVFDFFGFRFPDDDKKHFVNDSQNAGQDVTTSPHVQTPHVLTTDSTADKAINVPFESSTIRSLSTQASESPVCAVQAQRSVSPAQRIVEDEITSGSVPPRHFSQPEQNTQTPEISGEKQLSLNVVNSSAPIKSGVSASPGSSVTRGTSPAKSRNIISASRDNQGWKDAIEEMKREAAVLHARLKDSFASERKMLVDDLTNAKVELERKSRQEDDMKRLLTKLKMENEELKDNIKRADEKHAQQLGEIRAKYQEKSAFVAALEGRVQTLEATVQQLKDGRIEAINESTAEKHQFRILLEDLIQRENTMLRQYIDQMKQELEKRNAIIGVEIDQLKKSLSSADEAQALTEQEQRLLKYAEMQLIELENSAYDPTQTSQYKPTDPTDPIDLALTNLLNELNCPVRIEIVRIQPGEYFMDGQLKLSLLDGRLYVRIGSKQELFSEYAKNLYLPFFVQDEDVEDELSMDSLTNGVPSRSLMFTKKFLPDSLRETAEQLIERAGTSTHGVPQFDLLEDRKSLPHQFQPRQKSPIIARSVASNTMQKRSVLAAPIQAARKTEDSRPSSVQKTRVAPSHTTQRASTPPSRTTQSNQLVSKKVIQAPKANATKNRKTEPNDPSAKRPTQPQGNPQNDNPAIASENVLMGALKGDVINTGFDFSKLIPENIESLSEQQIRQLKRLALRKQIEEMQKKVKS